jgi:cobalt-zinc-cadmium efflux system protein
MSGHGHDHSEAPIRAAFFLNLVFSLVEFAGGLWTNSLAIQSDALHDFGDSFTIGLSWFLNQYSRKGRDSRYAFGYRRFSVLGAVINMIVLTAGSVWVLARAVPRFVHPEQPNAAGMVGFAVVGMLVNGAAAWRMRRDHSLNSRVVALHLLEDVLSWAAVLISGGVLLVADVPILDPILSVLIALFVLVNVCRNVRRVVRVFMQAAPENLNVSAIEEEFVSVPGVLSCHHTSCWSLDGERHVMSTHVVVSDAASKPEIMDIKCRIKELSNKHHFEHVTVEIEYEDEACHLKT